MIDAQEDLENAGDKVDQTQQAADEANDKLDAAKDDLAALESQTGITASDSNGLPQTGVDASVPLSMMGILALAGAGVVYMRRKFEN